MQTSRHSVPDAASHAGKVVLQTHEGRVVQRKFSATFPALLFAGLIATTGCTQEQQNKISRLGVTFLEGNYKVTYAVDGHVKSWLVEDGKITSAADKGYYYFWTTVDGNRRYVQTPIARTYIEEQ